MPGVNRENNFLYLTSALVVLLLSSALADAVPQGLFSRLLFQAVSLGTLAVAWLSLDFGPFWRRSVGLLGLLILVLNGVSAANAWALADLASLFLLLVFFLVCATAAARQVLFPEQVNINIVIGSIAIYLLMGLIWTVLYLFALELDPQSLRGLTYLNWSESFDRVLYFSYITLATLGYGDISPEQPLTQVLAALEAVSGTFYMAVVVASLISAHGRHTKNRDHD